MKKVIALIVSLIFLVAFTVGCKPAETPKPEVPKTAEAPAPEQTAEAPAQAPVPVPAPAPEKLAEPPDVVVVPSGPNYVYMVPNTVGLYFYNGYWYRLYKRHWYRSIVYNGAWTYIETPIVPRVILDIPPDYILHIPRGYHRIHYRDFLRDWRIWGHGRHWHRYDWYKHKWHRRHDRGDRWRDRGDRWRDRGDRRHDRGDKMYGSKDKRRKGI